MVNERTSGDDRANIMDGRVMGPVDMEDSEAVGAFIAEATRRFQNGLEYDKENRESAADDLRFRAGEQWPAEAVLARQGRPTLTINRLPTILAQVEGDVRMSRPSIKVRPVEDNDEDLADVREGLIRSIEDGSEAPNVYSQATVSAASCGMGYWRISLTESEEEFQEMDLAIRLIPNPFGVVWDPASQHVTREDARWCFVVSDVPLDEFKETYPDASPDQFFSAAHALDEEFANVPVVSTAEYWFTRREDVELFKLGDGSFVEADRLASAPLNVVARRTVKRRRVYMALLCGKQILGDRIYSWKGDRIPIFPVFGKEVHIGTRTVRDSLVRYAKDSQRMYNYFASASAESAMSAPKAKWLVTKDAIAGHEREWSNAHRAPKPYLTYNPDMSAPNGGMPVQAPPPPMQAAILQERQYAADDIKATTGVFDAALGARSNETSGVAIMARQRESDVGAYVFTDNMLAAVRATGRELNTLIPHVYTSERTVRIIGADMQAKVIKVNQPGSDMDLTRGKYDIAVSSGPSFTTRRQEATESLMAFIQAAPNAAPLVLDIIARNSDWPGADELEERLKTMLPRNLQTDKDGQPLPPDPMEQAQQQAAMQAMQLELQRGQAELAKLMAETENETIRTELEKVRVVAEMLENTIRMNAADVQPRTQVSA